jgi:CsoR family transcriptional regulator, copper-sensing transcriptional repressor
LEAATPPARSAAAAAVHAAHAEHTSQLARLRKIEGQVAGLVRMVEEKRYCVDILNQVRAARAALKRVEEGVLREHVEHCLSEALRGRDRVRQKAKVAELVAVLGRYAE